MKEDFIKETAAKLKKARQEAGYTMQSLAEKMGVSRQTVTNWESGNQNLTLDTIKRICDAIGVSVDIIFKEKKSGKKKGS